MHPRCHGDRIRLGDGQASLSIATVLGSGHLSATGRAGLTVVHTYRDQDDYCQPGRSSAHRVNGQRLKRWSSSPLPSSLSRLNLSGAAFARNCSRQPPSGRESAAEEKLDLGVTAAKLVLSPPGHCVVDCRIEPENDAFSLRNCPHSVLTGKATPR